MRISLLETCTAAVYRTSVVQEQMRQVLTEEAMRELGSDYHLLGDVQVQVRPTTQSSHTGGKLSLQVRASGTWGYQFSEEQLHRLATLIAGKSTQETTALLLGQPGVRTVSLHLADPATGKLPSSAQQIHFLIVEAS